LAPSSTVAMQQLCLSQGLDCWYSGTVIGGLFCPVYLGKMQLLSVGGCGDEAYPLCMLPLGQAFWTQG
jgi:hypothetical protein